jgi:outer membrane protein OmpA-like peptidoglycan-associated protein
MKYPVLVTLLLCAILALPGSAQQSNSTSSSQNAATAAPSVDTAREPVPPPTSQDFWDGDEPNLVNLIVHPFANKKYVQRLVRPIQDRVNELEQITAENSRSIKDVDARAQQGIQLASAKTDLADQHATDAGMKADTAKTAATQATTRVSTAEQLVSSFDQYKGNTQTEIRFRPGQSVLSKQAKDALDRMAAPLKGQNNYVIEVNGFSSGHGQAAIAASRTMADSVVRYLVLNHQIPMYRIHVLSLGNARMASEAAAAKPISGGRVEVNLLKNDLLTSAQH